jgi:hypothetical protein
VRNEAEIRLAVERMTARIVRALSAERPDMTAYRAAFHLPGVERQPGESADPIVIANLLANCADGVYLFPPDVLPPATLVPAAAEHRAALLAAAASGNRGRLRDTLVLIVNLEEQLLGEVTYALASDYTHVIRLCGGLPAVHDITGILTGAAVSPAETNILHAASLIVSATSAAPTRPYARYAADRISRQRGGSLTLTRMLGLLVRAAWVTVRKASPSPELSGTDDERLRAAGQAPRAESARRAVRLVRRAIVSLSAHEPEADVVRHVSALATLPTPDMIVAVQYATSVMARHVPAAVQTMVDQVAEALDPDRRQ